MSISKKTTVQWGCLFGTCRVQPLAPGDRWSWPSAPTGPTSTRWGSPNPALFCIMSHHKTRLLIESSLYSEAKVIKACSLGGARQIYYLRSPKQSHNSTFKTPKIIDFWGYLSIHGNLFALPSIWASSLFPILKTHFHLPMHMTAGRGKVISHSPGY